MQALVFEGPNRMVLKKVPKPEPDDGEVVVRIHSASICGSDLRVISGTKTRDVRVGHPIGHEAAGTVAAIGKGVRGYAVGDRVAVCVVVSCGTCEYCQANRENLCDTRITLGYHTDGAFAEYMPITARAVRRGNLFKLPEGISLKHAPLIEPMACCLNGQHEMGLGEGPIQAIPSGDFELVIFGAGPIGLLHLLLAKARLPRTRVTVVEPRQRRKEYAQSLGADVVLTPQEFDAKERFDAAIVAVGVSDLVPLAVRSVRKCGTVSLFAGFPVGSSCTVDPNVIHYRQIRVFGASESRLRDFAEAISLIAEKKIDFAPLATHRYPLADHEKAFQAAADGSALKVMLDISG